MRERLIIVGAGSSGCVIARRVVEGGQREVVLVEAGPDYPEAAALPADLADGRRNSMQAHDWGYKHRPTPRPLRFPFPRGRVVGGSSAVNTCIALRGQPADFDAWAALGLPEWSWRACLPAFKRLERDLDFGGEWHGQEGPLPIRRHPPVELVPWQVAFLEACASLGFEAAPDSNDPASRGAGPHAMNKLGGRRISAAEAYLTPALRARPELQLRPRTLVRRVLFEGRRVSGLELETGQGEIERLPGREVVLCAGAINTPALLLRSGVGPRAEVERLGVTLVADVPGVGARLLDHPGAAIFLRPKQRLSRPDDPLIQTVLRYRSEGSDQENDMLLQPGSRVALPWFDLPLVSLMTAVGKPRGFGELHFPSADPRAKPIIRSRILEDEADRRRAAQALALAFELVQTPAIRRLAELFWPSARVLSDLGRIQAWVRSACDSGYHPSGTVPMGPDADPRAATDGRGQVRGVEGLRVGDASLMPTIPSSNIHLPTLMIGERMGEWLRD